MDSYENRATAALGTGIGGLAANIYPTSVNINIRSAKNGIIISVNGSNAQKGYYSDEYAYTNLSDVFSLVSDLIGTPSNS